MRERRDVPLMARLITDVQVGVQYSRLITDFQVEVQYYGRRDPVILGQDTAGAGVDRTRYTGGYFLYALPQDTTKPAELVDYYVPNGTPQGTTEPASAARSVGPWGRAVTDKVRQAQLAQPMVRIRPPQDTTKPAELVDYYVPNGTSQDTTEPASAARINIKPLADRVVVEPAPAEERQIAYNAGVEGAIIVERRGNVLVVGNFTPTHVALPMPELEIDPGEGPVCGLPVPEEEQPSAGSVQARQYYYHNGWMWSVSGGYALASPSYLPDPQPPPPGTDGGPRYTVYVLNQAIATGPKPSGKILGVVTRQAPPQGGNQNMAGPISFPRPSDVGIPEFRMMPPGGGAPVLWPNGNPPRDPDWPWVGVIGTPVLEGIDGAPGPDKSQNWCGTEYIWTGPPPKSPKELILTPVIPRPR